MVPHIKTDSKQGIFSLVHERVIPKCNRQGHLPKPPAGGNRWAASPARKTRLSKEANFSATSACIIHGFTSLTSTSASSSPTNLRINSLHTYNMWHTFSNSLVREIMRPYSLRILLGIIEKAALLTSRESWTLMSRVMGSKILSCKFRSVWRYPSLKMHCGYKHFNKLYITALSLQWVATPQKSNVNEPHGLWRMP